MGYFKRSAIAVAAVLGISLAAVPAAHALNAQPCGLFKPCSPSDSAPVVGESYDGSTYELTLNADRTRPKTGQAVTFTGQVTRDGEPVSPEQFDLVAAKYPYDSEVVVASTGPTTDSAFSFTDVPQANTRYFVRTGDLDPGDGSFAMTSSPLLIRVFARLKSFDVTIPRDGLVKMSFAADFPDGLSQKLTSRKMRWYIVRGKGESRRVTKIAVTRTTWGGSARIAKARVLAVLPPGSYRFKATFCLTLGSGRDVGVGDPAGRCP